MMENNYFFIKCIYQITEHKEGCSCNLYIIALYCCKKRRTPIYLIKTVLKRNLKSTLNAIIQHEEK